MQRWLVKVFDNGKPAYNEAFWTKSKALDFIGKIQNGGVRWHAELVRLGK